MWNVPALNDHVGWGVERFQTYTMNIVHYPHLLFSFQWISVSVALWPAFPVKLTMYWACSCTLHRSKASTVRLSPNADLPRWVNRTWQPTKCGTQLKDDVRLQKEPLLVHVERSVPRESYLLKIILRLCKVLFTNSVERLVKLFLECRLKFALVSVARHSFTTLHSLCCALGYQPRTVVTLHGFAHTRHTTKERDT